MLRYEFYRNWGSEHYWVELQENQISCTTLKDKKPTHTRIILLQDIATIKLTKNESFGNVSYECDIKSKNGDFITFCTWGEEKHFKQYKAFLTALHENCSSYSNIKFEMPFGTRKNPLDWVIISIVVVIVIISWWKDYTPLKNNIALLGVGLGAIGWILQNTLTQSYEVKKIPKELLPKV